MLDQCIITVPYGPLVKPEIFTDENFEIDGWLQFYAVNENKQRKRQRQNDGYAHSGQHWFNLFGPRVLSFRTKHVGSRKELHRQVIDRIELNLAKIAHGHNAIPIRDEEELCGLLILVRHVLSRVLVDPSKASSLIPGLVKNSLTHWSKIEIGMHIEDPGKAFYKLMRRRMRSNRARKLEFLDNTVRLNGTNVMLKVYNKASQLVATKQSSLKNLVPSTKLPITRIEVELRNKEAASFDYLPVEDRPLVRKTDGKRYLEGFTLDQLKAIHRDYFSELEGIYHSPKKPGEGDQAGMAAVLAAVHLRSEMPIDELLDLYVGLGMRDQKKPQTEEEEKVAKTRARRDMRAKVERFLEESSTLTAAELLSDEAYGNQPTIDVKDKYGMGEIYVNQYRVLSIWELADDHVADRQIDEVYMSREAREGSRSVNPRRFRPKTKVPRWWRKL